MTLTTTTRNATLADTIAILREQQTRRVDVVAGAGALRVKDGNLIVKGSEAEISEDGVTSVDGVYRPTDVFDEGLAGKLGIPVAYLRRMRSDAPDLYAANVNGWLHGKSVRQADGTTRVDRQGDVRKFMIRAFKGDEGSTGIARAFLSNSYGILDSLDFTSAALDGIRKAGVDINPADIHCDLSDRRMYVRVDVPQISTLAPALLDGYRSPFTGQSGNDIPVVSAGLVFGNSEVGCGSFFVKPRIKFRVCDNGMTIEKATSRGVHLGARLEEGNIKWSLETERKTLALVTSKVTDAVTTFLSKDYLDALLADMAEEAGVRLGQPSETIEHVAKRCGFSQSEQEGIFADFIAGGQVTAGGVMQAVTAFAQRVDDADAAANLEAKALDAMSAAVQFASR